MVIKYVAGGGKTTFSKKYLNDNSNGLYLAFNNKVIQDIYIKGYLSKTIDSLFMSFIIPKIICLIPIISNCSKIIFLETDNLPNYLKNVSQLKIEKNGKIYCKTKLINVNMNVDNSILHSMSYFPNSKALKYIFDFDKLRLTHELRAELCDYIISNFPEKALELLYDRFDYIIIDEAQDLSGYREKFVELLYNSGNSVVILGDDNQNINSGGKWFENLQADRYETNSFRCPEVNCAWIRENLNIEINGNSDQCTFEIIRLIDAMQYDDGERFLLYVAKSGKKVKKIIDNWSGPKDTIKGAKGRTIYSDVVIIGDTMNYKNLYTAITRTKKNVYSTIKSTKVTNKKL